MTLSLFLLCQATFDSVQRLVLSTFKNSNGKDDDMNRRLEHWTIHKPFTVLHYFILAYRPAMRTFQLALRGYSVASLPRRFALTKIFNKKRVSQSTQNSLKRIEMQKNRSLNHYALRAKRSERQGATIPTPDPCGRLAPSSFTLRAHYLPHDTPRVLRSVHAKFYHDRIKTMGARGIQTYIQT